MVPESIFSSLVGAAKPDTSSIADGVLSPRSTLVRKREDANIDLDEEEEEEYRPSSPVKRAKVAFSEDVEVNLVDDWDKAPELIREEVHRALKRQAQGDSDGYDKIKQVYKTIGRLDDEVPSAETVRYHTVALLSNVELLNRSCSGLVRLVLRSEWVRQDDEYVSLFTKFLEYLVSAQVIWLEEVMEMLVGKFAAGTGTHTLLTHPVTNTISFKTKR